MKISNNDNNQELYDILGIGIGVFNMSMAALLAPLQNISYKFFDQCDHFKWHNGMLLPESYLQTPYLDDLVTSIDPTNPYSFLSFLVKSRRFHAFTNVGFEFVYRAEFAEYLEWASKIIPNLNFGEQVKQIDFADDYFTLHTTKQEIRSKNIVIGTGTVPHIPEWALGKLGPNIYHNSEFLSKDHDWQHKRVVIIGGGQSGAEILYYILSNNVSNLPKEITWISSRSLFLQLDNAPFTAELFSSSYVEYFFHWTKEQRKQKLNEQLMASDGISLKLLNDLYRLIYKLKLIDKIHTKITLLPDHKVTKLDSNKETTIHFYNLISEIERIINTDIVILCTGNKHSDLNFLSKSLMSRIKYDDNQPEININYSVTWDGPIDNNIYLQNSSRNNHGIMDSNIPLIPWRNAIIINNIVKKTLYDTTHESGVIIDWNTVYGNKI